MTTHHQHESSLYINLLKKILIDYANIDSYEYYPLTMVNPNWKTFIQSYL